MLNMMKKPGTGHLHLSGLLVVFVLLIAGFGTSIAQQSTPASTAAAHPANIYQGTCDNLGNIRFPLTGVSTTSTPESMATPDGMSTPTGVEISTGIEASETLIKAPLTDFPQGANAIAIQESTANSGNIIACGDIAGSIAPAPSANQGRFIRFPLRASNNSGYSGVGYLQETSDGTSVLIYLTSPPTNGTPEASTPVANQGKTAFRVDIKNFAYSPSTITIPVGGTITWTNNDSTAHTVTAQDRKVLQSGTMKPGATYSQTFKTPGTYHYFCEFHANMKGTIIVK